LLFLNNDTEAIDADWLSEIAGWAIQPEIGIVGAKLLYPDLRIQHAGIVVGMEGHGSHIFAGKREGYSGIFGSVDWYRNYSAVTGACMAIRREVFDKIGGFDEEYDLVFSDIDICLRAIATGYRVIYNPFARLIHHEGKTRHRHIPAKDYHIAYQRLKSVVERGDPFYNPNLSYSIRIPTFKRTYEETPIQRLESIVQQKAYP
jgi:GT2 family glycosyltransferase